MNTLIRLDLLRCPGLVERTAEDVLLLGQPDTAEVVIAAVTPRIRECLASHLTYLVVQVNPDLSRGVAYASDLPLPTPGTLDGNLAVGTFTLTAVPEQA